MSHGDIDTRIEHMKIAILNSGNLGRISAGGVTQYVKKLIKFCDDGEITVFGTGDYQTSQIGKKEKRIYAGKNYYFVPVSTNKRTPLSIFYFLNEFRFLPVLEKYDVIFSQRIEYTLPFLFRKKARRKLFQIVHGSIKYSIEYYGKMIGWMLSKLERLSIRIAQKTFVILQRKEVGVPYYQNEYRRYKDKIEYGKVPIDTRLFRKMDKKESREKLGIPTSAKVILYLGRLDDDPKRILLYPEIVADVKKQIPDICFYVIGNGADEVELMNRTKKYDLEDCMKMVGYVEAGEELSTYLSASDATINLSKFEGTCTSTLESIACERPVVTTDVGDVERYLPEGKNGIIIPNDSFIVENAKKAIVDILNNPTEMTEIYKEYDGPQVIGELKNFFKGD